jgi:hypothetical protein
VERHLAVPRWRGLRVVAADASKLRLFGQDATGRKVREALAFLLYLPGLELTLDFELYSPAVGERQMLFEHLPSLRADDLVVLDRGYPAGWLVAALLALGRPFCMRVDATGFAAVRRFLRSGQAEAVVNLPRPSARDTVDYGVPRVASTVRLVRVVTPSGRVQVLMTSLLDAEAFPAADFGALYHARWRIEEAFKRIKHRLALEQVSGLTWLAAQQDFGAKVVCDNLNALAAFAAAPEPVARPGGAPATTYRPNRTAAFKTLKTRLQRWLTGTLPTLAEIQDILARLLTDRVQIVPGLSKPRPPGFKPHRYFAYKSCA